MLGRALSLATVTLLIGCFAASSAHAQATNLEAGKSPSQIFAGTCSACHKSARGLLKSVPPGSLGGFLRQHYTTSPEMAGLLASYLISNGATDTRYQGKPDRDGKPGGPPEQLDRQGRRIHAASPPQEPARPEAEPQQAARPDADGLGPEGVAGRKGRNARRLARPAEEGTKPAEGEAAEPGLDGRRPGSKRHLGKRGRPGEEMPQGESGREEPAAAKEDTPAGEAARDDSAKPSADSKPETARIEAPKEPVPVNTPAAGTPEPAAAPPAAIARPAAPVTPPAPQSAATTPPPPPAAAAPPPAPTASDGPPTPPISR